MAAVDGVARRRPGLQLELWRMLDAGGHGVYSAAHDDDRQPHIFPPSPLSRGTGAQSRMIVPRAAG